ncbi:MAG TPA: tRNA pseudouridine(55) synthase TruB [Mycobacteriales bacterium]|nr:tRNA pseudouridine(55) synthase TruB [Mycobacteriales bacterium]
MADSGLVLVDKPTGWTSHDVVARVRRLAGTRRVGHAGTLDPMATGVLVVGVERATKLLGHLALADKAYLATMRLGWATITDDSEGEPLGGASAEAVTEAVTEATVRTGLTALTGEIDQVPSAVSAVKVDGRRAYARVRAGQAVDLAPRRVLVSRLDLLALRRDEPGLVDLDVVVECTSGTYVRALARDLGAALGVGGHLTALRRTRVGPFAVDDCVTLAELEEQAELAGRAGAGHPGVVSVPLDRAVTGGFVRRDVTADQARLLAHGGKLPAVGIGGTYGVFGPDGRVVALVREERGSARPLVVLRPA